MEESPPKMLNIESVVLFLAIITGFVGAAIIFTLLSTGLFADYLLAAGIAVILGFAILLSVEQRKLIYSAVALVVVGIVVVSATLVPMLPYISTETVKNVLVTDLAPFFHTFGYETPVLTNGSFSVISLPSDLGKVFMIDSSYIEGAANTSIVQIEISTSAPLEFSIGELNSVVSNSPDNSYFNQTVPARTIYGYPTNWVTFYWTPSGLQTERTTAFLFRNLNNQSLQFSFNATEFNLKNTDTVEIQEYRPLLGTYYAYVGISLIILGLVLNVVSYLWLSRTSLNRLQHAIE
jgi:hypothetical protein